MSHWHKGRCDGKLKLSAKELEKFMECARKMEKEKESNKTTKEDVCQV